VSPSFTLNAGLRYEKQFPFENLNNTYTRVGIEGVWGISGVGNLFRPGVTPGKVPQYTLGTAGGDAYKIPGVWAPSIGAAWQLPKGEGLLGILLGKHQGAAVLRGGYSIANIREGWNVFTSIWGANQGLNADASLAPNTFPADFGAPGSVWFRDANLPSRSGLPSTPVYPIPASFSSSVNEFDPKLKMGYVQSWNIGWQRELGRDTVVEVRYTGNHGVHLWRQYNLNERPCMFQDFSLEAPSSRPSAVCCSVSIRPSSPGSRMPLRTRSISIRTVSASPSRRRLPEP